MTCHSTTVIYKTRVKSSNCKLTTLAYHRRILFTDFFSQSLKNSAFQAEQYREQEAFARKEIRNPGQYNYPPESLEIISVSSFCNRYGLNLQLPRSIQSVVLYHIGMTYIRSDPYVGMAALYKTLYGDESNIVVLEFANIDSSSWFEQQRTSKTYRMYKTFCDAILFRDEFIWQEKL